MLLSNLDMNGPHNLVLGMCKGGGAGGTCSGGRDDLGKAMQDLEGWLCSSKTDPKLVEAIMAGLRGWYSGTNLLPMTNLQAVIQQNWLEWDLFMEGGISQEWQTEQAKLWATIKMCRLSKQWVSELIKKLWDISWDLWTNRNEELHTSKMAKVQILENDINTRICQAFQSSSRDLPQDALHLLQTLPDSMLVQPMITKQQWLDTLEAAKCRQARALRDPMASKWALMEAWANY